MMIPSEQDNGLHLNQRGEMDNTRTAISTVDGRFFFVTDEYQSTEWVLIEVSDAEQADISAMEVQEHVFGDYEAWWALTINHGSYLTFGHAYLTALRIMDGGVA
jgi:hypothetical protein